MTSQEIQKNLLELSGKATALGHRITETLERSEKNVALSNFCGYISGELRHVSGFYPDNISGLAWLTRNLFETNLIIRHVLTSESNFLEWLGQALQDEKDVIDGLLSLSTDSRTSPAETQRRVRLAELQDMAHRHVLKFSKPFRISEIAKPLDLLEEYNSLYKLFSKYVHPSSLLINCWHRQTPDANRTNIFLTKSQTYSGDSIYRINGACGFQSGAT